MMDSACPLSTLVVITVIMLEVAMFLLRRTPVPKRMDVSSTTHLRAKI